MNTLLTDCGARSSGISDSKDCTVRATAAVLDIPYSEAHSKLAALGRKPKRGIQFKVIAPKLGLEIRPDLSCRKLSSILPEIQSGRFVVRVRHHVFAVIDGTALDNAQLSTNANVKMAYQLPTP